MTNSMAPLDLDIGHCRLAVAEPAAMVAHDNPRRWSQIRIATKYPEVTKRHFAARGVQAQCIRLNGAMELAPSLGLCRRIVDLVASGATLKANGLVESRAYRGHHVLSHRQPHPAQDAHGGASGLDRALPGGLSCRGGLTRPIRILPEISTR